MEQISTHLVVTLQFLEVFTQERTSGRMVEHLFWDRGTVGGSSYQFVSQALSRMLSRSDGSKFSLVHNSNETMGQIRVVLLVFVSQAVVHIFEMPKILSQSDLGNEAWSGSLMFAFCVSACSADSEAGRCFPLFAAMLLSSSDFASIWCNSLFSVPSCVRHEIAHAARKHLSTKTHQRRLGEQDRSEGEREVPKVRGRKSTTLLDWA